jgi:hypothetical protein
MSPLLQTLGAASVRAFGWSRGSNGGGGAMELISTQLISSSTASVTFSSIPSTYKHLQIRYTGNNSGGTNGSIQLQFNADTGANYASHYLQGNGSSVSSAQAGNSNWIIGPNFGYSVGASAGILDILDYTSTAKNKTVRGLGGYAVGQYYVSLISGVWLNTSAITSVLVQGSFVSSSRISLYGVKG